MAYSMCGVESRFYDGAMPMCSGSPMINLFCGCISAVHTVCIRRGITLRSVCLRGVVSSLYSLNSDVNAGAFLDEVGLVTDDELYRTAFAVRNAVMPVSGKAAFRLIYAVADFDPTRQSSFVFATDTKLLHEWCGRRSMSAIFITAIVGFAGNSESTSNLMEDSHVQHQFRSRRLVQSDQRHPYHHLQVMTGMFPVKRFLNHLNPAKPEKEVTLCSHFSHRLSLWEQSKFPPRP